METPKIRTELANGELVIRITPVQDPPRSKSGKSRLLASTRGALTLSNGSKLNLNWYAPL